MPVKDQTHILANYSGLMEEIKTRLSVVRRIVFDGSRGGFAFESYILGELCHLQLRMICETIALGCLLVHGDIAATRAGLCRKRMRRIGSLTGLRNSTPISTRSPASII